MSILILACLLAICLPILSVQIPRFYPSIPTLTTFFESRSTRAENRSSLHERTPSLGRSIPQRRTAAASRSAQLQGRGEATDGADSGAGTSETGSEEIHNQPTTATRLLIQRVEGKGKGRADGRETRRKPWDPPFPRREDSVGAGKERVAWRILPPTPPHKSGREMEATGVAKRLFPSDADSHGEYIPEEEDQHQPNELESQMTPRSSSIPAHVLPAEERSTSIPLQTTRAKKPRDSPSVISGIWLCLAILAALLFVLAFAILIAHCLAWFLVYKTEARLGEARRGIMQGGEMRLCLCAT